MPSHTLPTGHRREAEPRATELRLHIFAKLEDAEARTIESNWSSVFELGCGQSATVGPGATHAVEFPYGKGALESVAYAHRRRHAPLGRVADEDHDGIIAAQR